MAPSRENTTDESRNNPVSTTAPDRRVPKVDPTAPAGSKNSWGRKVFEVAAPQTDDGTIEAIDEVGPGVSNSAARKNDEGRNTTPGVRAKK